MIGDKIHKIENIGMLKESTNGKIEKFAGSV
jgi:hypothetical protein